MRKEENFCQGSQKVSYVENSQEIRRDATLPADYDVFSLPESLSRGVRRLPDEKPEGRPFRLMIWEEASLPLCFAVGKFGDTALVDKWP